MVTSEETREIVSRNLQKILRDKQLSQSDIARRLFPDVPIDVKHRLQVSRWVNGLVLPSSANVCNLAEVLGVKVSDILLSAKTKKNL